jgi:hypothetical protein
MFVGHFAVGLAAKPCAPRVSLVWLLFAPNFLDVLWPLFVLTGIEVAAIDPGHTAFTPLDLAYMPWSHSLAATLVWSIALAAIYLVRHDDRRGALVIAALVASHWVLDWLTHAPDLPLAPGVPTRVGLGLWNSIPATLALELTIFAAGTLLYMRATEPIDRTGTRGLVALVAFLLVAYFAVAFGPLPPTLRAVNVGMLVLAAALAIWARWLERHRRAL